jgi:hypothetical protein
MECAVHLGSEEFAKGVSPTARNVIIMKVWDAFENAKQGKTININKLDVGLKECEDITGVVEMTVSMVKMMGMVMTLT